MLCISAASVSPAQHHYNAWFRGTLSIAAGKKTWIDTELQHRRQNGLGNANMFDHDLMFAYRSWVHYQPREGLRLSVSPFACFSNYRIIQQQADEGAAPRREIRFSAAVELKHRISRKLYLTERSAIEQRFFDQHQPGMTRLRTRPGFHYDLTGTLRLGIYDELFLHIAGASYSHFFDQNRVGLDLSCKVTPNLKIDAGYLYISRLPLRKATKIYEKNVYLNLAYSL